MYVAPGQMASADEAISWLERTLPRIMRRLSDTRDLDTPLLKLPVAQLRLAMALYAAEQETGECGETMGRLSERLGVRHNALTQAADRLVNNGLAERVNDAHDRRVVRLRLSTTGHEWVRERRARRRERLGLLWEILDEGEREELLQAFTTVERLTGKLEGHAGGESPAVKMSTLDEMISKFSIPPVGSASVAEGLLEPSVKAPNPAAKEG